MRGVKEEGEVSRSALLVWKREVVCGVDCVFLLGDGRRKMRGICEKNDGRERDVFWCLGCELR